MPGEAEKRYSEEEARNEAEILSKKVESGEAKDYTDAEEQIEQEPVDFEFKILKDPKQRELLMEKVDGLVGKIESGEYTNVIFLDKSARPLSTLCLDLWHRKFPDKEFPKINFMNIGREVGEKLSKKHGKKDIEKVFGQEEMDEHVNWIKDIAPEVVMDVVGEVEKERVQNTYEYLADAQEDNKVLVIEELSLTGESAVLARKILKTLFPQLNLEIRALTGEESKLFRISDGWGDEAHNPPWRKNIHDRDYGITGVVDDNEHLLTAKPTREQSLDERLAAVDIDIAGQYKRLEEEFGFLKKLGVSEVEDIKDFGNIDEDTFRYSDRLDRTATRTTIKIAKQYVKGAFLPIVLKVEPYIEELKLIGAEDGKNIAKISEILEKIKSIDSEMHGAFEGMMHSLWEHVPESTNPSNFDRENPHIFDRLIEENNVAESRKEIKSAIQQIMLSKIFKRSRDNYFIEGLPVSIYTIGNIQYLNKRKDLMRSTDYGKLVAEFRTELHHAVAEYCEKHGI